MKGYFHQKGMTEYNFLSLYCQLCSVSEIFKLFKRHTPSNILSPSVMEQFSLDKSSALDVEPTSSLTVSGSGKQRKARIVAPKDLDHSTGSSFVSRHSVWKPPQLSLQHPRPQPIWAPDPIARQPSFPSRRPTTMGKTIPDEAKEANSKPMVKLAKTSHFNSSTFNQRTPIVIHGGRRAPARNDSDGEGNDVESEDDSHNDSNSEPSATTKLNGGIVMRSDRKSLQSDVDADSDDGESVSQKEKVSESDDESSDTENSSADSEDEVPEIQGTGPSTDSEESDEPKPDIIQGAGTSSSKPSKRRMEVIYFRTTSTLSVEKGDKVMDLLRVDHPKAKVILETQSSRAPIDERQGFERLLELVLDRRVKKLLIAKSTHVCNTKDAFQLFEWMCSKHGTEIDILPSLELP
jgi:hypothetical protein